jgi:hypothetical protein
MVYFESSSQVGTQMVCLHHAVEGGGVSSLGADVRVGVVDAVGIGETEGEGELVVCVGGV